MVKNIKRKAKEADRPHVSLDNVQIENVHQFVYLGSCFQSDGDSMADVKHRMNLAQSTFSELHHLWRDHRLPTSLKIRLYQSAVCSSLTHASEAWEMSGKVKKTINGFNSRCLSVITKGDTHELAISPPFDLIKTIRRRRLRYLGHVLRMDSERLVLKTLMALTKGGTEYPPGSLFMDVEDIPFEELLSLASDKSYWKALVAGL